MHLSTFSTSANFCLIPFVSHHALTVWEGCSGPAPHPKDHPHRWGTEIETRSSRQLICLFRSGGTADIKRRSWAGAAAAAREGGRRGEPGKEGRRGEGGVYKPQVRWIGEWENAEKKAVREREEEEEEKKKKKNLIQIIFTPWALKCKSQIKEVWNGN